MTTTPFPASGVRALADIAWMAARQAEQSTSEVSESFAEAAWLLERLAAKFRVGARPVTTVLVAPPAPRAAELGQMSDVEAVQWICEVIHPLAHQYADGRSTYAPGMLNDATRVLRAAGFSLAKTEALGKSVWVTDGMGDAFLSLSAAEAAERDRARAS